MIYVWVYGLNRIGLMQGCRYDLDIGCVVSGGLFWIVY